MYTNSKFWNELDNIGSGIARLKIEISIGGDPRIVSSIPNQIRYYESRLKLIAETGNGEEEEKRATEYLKDLGALKSQYNIGIDEEISIRTIKKVAKLEALD